MRPATASRALGAAAGLILALGTAQAASPVFTPLRADSVYRAGERAGWVVTVPRGATAEPGSYSYRITRDEKAVVKTGSFDLKAGRAQIDLPTDAPGSYRVIVDYMAPPPPPLPSPTDFKAMNEAVRALMIKTDPGLKDVLSKYPHYAFIRPSFDFTSLREDRVAALTASVRGR